MKFNPRPRISKRSRLISVGLVAVTGVASLVLPRIAANADTFTRIAINDVSKAEGTGGTTAYTFTISLNQASTNNVTVAYTTQDGSAKAGSDYTTASGSVTFAALTEVTKQVTVNVAADAFPEPDETFTLKLTSTTSGQFNDDTGTGTILNDDTGTAVPSVSVTGPAPVTEGNAATTPAVFTVNVTPTVGQDVTVNYATASGTATSGADFTSTTGTLTIPANQPSATIPVPVVGDTLDEDNETFTLSLSNPNNATLATASTATATITDDDASPNLSIGDTSVGEGNLNDRNTANFQVTLSAPTTRDVTFAFTPGASVSSPDATPNEDYLATPGTVTIPAGSTTAVVSVTVIGDTIKEQNEFFDVVLSDPTNAGIADGTGTATIQDDENQPTVTIGSVGVVEGNAGTSNATVAFTLSAASGAPVSVDYTTATGGANGTATAGSDFTSASGTVTFAPGETTAQVNIAIVGDLLDEADAETFRVVGSNVQGEAVLAGSGFGTVTINDDDTAPTIAITDVTQAEGNGSGVTPFVFTVSLSKASGRDVTVNAATGDPVQPSDPTAPSIPVASNTSDYSAVATTVTISAGATSQTVTVNVNKDSLDEANEVFNVILTSPTGATIADSRGVGTITNDDAGPAVTVAAATPSTTEGNSTISPKTVTFTVSLAQASTKQVRVNYATVDGSATSTAGAGSAADYTAASGTLTFSPGVTSQQFTVSITGDTLPEPDEAFSAQLSNPVNATLGTPSSATQLIQNDDAGAIPAVSVSDSPDTTEGGSATFTFTATGTVQQTVTVNYTTANGPSSGSANPAVEPADYTKTTGSVTFTVAQPGAKTVTVPTINDASDEDDEFFHIVITSVQNGTQTNTDGDAKIVDNDNPPTIAVADKTIDEGTSANATAATATVTLSAASSKTVTVAYSTGGGTATPTTDYASTSGTLTFAPGEASKTINLSVIGDALDEINETFNITLADPTNATIGDGTGVVTITDDDAQPTLSLGTAPVVSEGSGTDANTLDFVVGLSAPSGRNISVTLTPSAGTATASTDFTAAPITVTFAPGETTKTASVPVTADAVDEDNETVTATLSAPTNATLGTPSTQAGTITDDDEAPTITISNATAAEGGTATFTITLSAASSKQVTVKATSASGSATAGSDYTTLPTTTITFAPGETTKTVAVTTTQDSLDESDETFTVSLTEPANATLGTPASGTGTITDNDDAPTLSIADKSVAEGTGANPTATTVTVTLSAASGKAVTVDYATGGGTATATTDYAPATGTLTIPAGQTTGTINLNVVADSVDEVDETFNVTLSAPTNATITDGTGVVTITDDDAAPTVSFGAAPSIAEGTGSATNTLNFPVNLSAASGKTVTVTVTPSNGTATAGTDFTATPITVTFAPGDTTKTANVPITADSTDEANETVTATLSAPSNATLGSPTTQTGTISNDDAPTPVLTVSNASGSEGGVAEFTINQSTVSSTDVTVKVNTANGTATAGADYGALTNLTVTIPAGQTSKKFTVDLIEDDTDDEPAETFTVTLSEPSSNATLGTAKTGTGTILADGATVPAKITTGPGAGGGPHIKTHNANDTLEANFFDGSETTGKRVARGDLDGDGVDEIITAGGANSSGFVSVYTATGTFVVSVLPYGNNFRGGVFVAAGDVDGDGRDEVITGAGPGGGPHVRTFRYIFATNSPASLSGSNGFFAYDPGFGGGVSVGTGDLNADGTDEILTGMASGGNTVRSFAYNGAGSATKGVEFNPYGAFTGGAFVAGGNITGDAKAEIATSTGPGGGGAPHLRTFSPNGTSLGDGVFAYDAAFRGGISVAIGDMNGDGVEEIITGAGPGGGPHVKVYNAAFQEQRSFFAYDTAFRSGIWVAAGVSS